LTAEPKPVRPPFRINIAFLLESENDAEAQHVDGGFDPVAAAPAKASAAEKPAIANTALILFINALLVKWKGGAEDIVPLLIVLAYIYR
jgi:hypothetical protein